MIYAILNFTTVFNPQMIRGICLNYNIIASILDERDNTWCLETENAANLFWFGYDYKEKISNWYAENTLAKVEFKPKRPAKRA